MSYPVQLDVTSPPHFERIQLALRLAIAIAIGWLGSITGWLPGMVFFALPVIAATVVSTRGAQHYADDVAPTVWRAIRWLLAVSAYMLLLVDRFPTSETTDVQVAVRPDAHPTTGSALLRLLTSIPSAVVLGIIGIASSVLSVIGIVTILIDGRVPQAILAFQRGVLRWQARLLAYHASLVDEYPPFSFEATESPPVDRARMI
ncbi:MAG TPA: DUF4389 domain-containing protein [Kofleriaceae bacterium]|jgi:hypothetical protein